MLASFYAAGLALALVLPVALHRWLFELPWSVWALVRKKHEALAKSSRSTWPTSSSRHVSGPRRLWATRSMRPAALVLALLGVPRRADAAEVDGGVGVGGILAGTVPHLAVSPYGDVSWPRSSGFLIALHEMISVVVPSDKDGVGVYEQTSVAVGYAAEKRNFSVGPSLSIYSMPACGAMLCGRVVGLAPGGHAQVNVFLYGRLGVSVNATLDWVGGRSLVLPGGLAAMVVAGPVLRWSPE
jgi:hypothetical protein